MGKIVKEYVLGNMVFWVCLSVTIILFALGFFMPPMGEISPSVLTASGVLAWFATIGVATDSIKTGLEFKATHGDTTIEIKDSDRDGDN